MVHLPPSTFESSPLVTSYLASMGGRGIGRQAGRNGSIPCCPSQKSIIIKHLLVITECSFSRIFLVFVFGGFASVFTMAHFTSLSKKFLFTLPFIILGVSSFKGFIYLFAYLRGSGGKREHASGGAGQRQRL